MVNKTCNQVKIKTMEWDRVFARYSSNRELMPEYAKNSKNTQSRRQKTYLRKQAAIPKGEFAEEQVKCLRYEYITWSNYRNQKGKAISREGHNGT